MEKTNKRYDKILIFLLALGLLLAAAFFLGAETASKNCANYNGCITINCEKSPVVIYPFDKNSKESTVFSGLLDYGSRNNVEIKYNNNYEYGVFVESIGGVKNGDDGKYWQYYINNVLGDVAADKKNLSSSDVVEWRFEEVPF